MSKTQEFKNGKWQDARPEPYYPNWFERLTHWLGFHWYYQCNECVICGIRKETR